MSRKQSINSHCLLPEAARAHAKRRARRGRRPWFSSSGCRIYKPSQPTRAPTSSSALRFVMDPKAGSCSVSLPFTRTLLGGHIPRRSRASLWHLELWVEEQEQIKDLGGKQMRTSPRRAQPEVLEAARAALATGVLEREGKREREEGFSAVFFRVH